jgi:hypothetical protein
VPEGAALGVNAVEQALQPVLEDRVEIKVELKPSWWGQNGTVVATPSRRSHGSRQRTVSCSCCPADPASIAEALVAGAAPDRDRLRDMGLRRAGEFTWAAAAASTLGVYREVAERRRRRRA